MEGCREVPTATESQCGGQRISISKDYCDTQNTPEDSLDRIISRGDKSEESGERTLERCPTWEGISRNGSPTWEGKNGVVGRGCRTGTIQFGKDTEKE